MFEVATGGARQDEDPLARAPDGLPAPTPGSFRVGQYLSPDEIKRLLGRSDLRGAIATGRTLLGLALGFAIYIIHPTWWTAILAVVILGTRQMGLGVLMHEAAHRTLFRTRRVNDLVGDWIASRPMWLELSSYRASHLGHHRDNATLADPDLIFVLRFPSGRRSLLVAFAKDLVGITAVMRLVSMLLVAGGFIRYSPAGEVIHLDQRGRSLLALIGSTAVKLGGLALTHGVLLGIFVLLGHPEAYLLWWLAWATVFNAVARVRTIVEHAGTGDPFDPIVNSRTTRGDLLERMLVAPHQVNFHLEHHLVMTVPFFRLPELRGLLAARGALDRAARPPSVLTVLALVSDPSRCQVRSYPPSRPHRVRVEAVRTTATGRRAVVAPFLGAVLAKALAHRSPRDP